MTVWTGTGNVEAATVCSLSSVPSGHVITEKRSSSACGVAGFIYVTALPPTGTATLNICSTNGQIPLPLTHAMTSKRQFAQCHPSSSQYGLGFIIRLPPSTGTLVVCNGSPIPAGYADSQYQNYSGCGGDVGGIAFGPGFIITPIDQNPGSLCTVPAGYVITNKVSSSKCPAGVGYFVSLPPTGTNSLVACNGSTIPTGYVLTTKRQYQQCNPTSGQYALGSSIRLPPSTGTLVVCNGTTVPSGYVGSQYQNYSGCGGDVGGTALGLGFIIGLADQNPGSVCTVPTGYVITSKVDSSKCPNSIGYFISLPPTGTNSLVACNGSTIPTGYVLTTKRQYQQCNPTSGQYALGSSIRLPPSTGTLVVCNGTTVPSGYVGSQYQNYSGCGGDVGGTALGLGFIIGLADQNPGSVCTVPDGYIITSKVDSSKCPNSIGYLITKPAGGATYTACNGSAIPTGYIKSKIDNYGACGIGTAFGLGFEIKVPGVGPEIACNGSPLPAGYIKSGIDIYGACGVGTALGSGFEIKVPQGVGPHTACGIYVDSLPIPTGYVVTTIGVYGACGVGVQTAPGFQIKYPNSTGQTIICQGTLVPNGYVAVGTLYVPACGGSGVIIEAVNSGIAVIEFINPEPDVVPGTVPPVTIICPSSGPQNSGFIVTTPKNSASCP